ncbi:TPA: radical SAM protein, partial [Candidatus Micrarchaeota archaeon]|nr:radical SAM protein [Candidatus Micrarchaeota archaeon]
MLEAGRRVVKLYDDTPMMGHIAFGVIDRGTNVVQVRPTTICNLNCIFCSVDAGPGSRFRQVEYVVEDLCWLVDWVVSVARFKGVKVEALIDGVGDPLTHPRIVELVSMLKDRREVATVSLETHGQLLSYRLADELAAAGLDRINLSIDALDPRLASKLQGAEWFDVRKVVEVAEYMAESTKVDVHLTPVWIPGINDEEIEKIIEWALRVGFGKRCPALGIQKYVKHKYGRKVPGVKEMSWGVFYRRLRALERKYGIKLVLSMKDYGMKPAPRV